MLLLYCSAYTSDSYSAGTSVQMLLLPLLGVVFIIFLAYVFTKWFTKKYRGIAAGRYVKVIERVSVGKDKDLLMVEVNGQAYLLGVTGQNITTVCSFDAGALPPKQELSATGFRSIFDSALKRDWPFKMPFGGNDGDGETKQP